MADREFIFKPAVRLNTPMIIGISGASGAGKTFTALELGMGLAGGGRILFLDTEGRRGLHYADRFHFDHCDFAAPFPPRDFLIALKQAHEAKYAVIIVDSFSEEYTGEGGITEMHDAELPRFRGNSIGAWAKPKAEHKLVVGWLRQSRCHVILCLRADEKIKLDKNNKPIDNSDAPPIERWVPICERRLPYELTTSFLLVPQKPGIPHPIKLQEQHRHLFPLNKPVTRETGIKLAEWCAGGTPAPIAPLPPTEPVSPREPSTKREPSLTREPHDKRELEPADDPGFGQWLPPAGDPHMPPF